MRYFFTFATLLLFVACTAYRPIAEVADVGADFWKSKRLPPSPQDTTGNPEAGFDYLIHGDYIGSGVPLEIMQKSAKRMAKEQPYERNELNRGIPYNMTAFVASNGAEVANGNCFTCHAGHLDGELIIGAGESFSDYETSMVLAGKLMKVGMALKYNKKKDDVVAAWEDFGDYFQVMAPHIKTNQPGGNPAFRLAEACMMHRDPQSLEYVDEPLFEMWDYNVATDTPPLWNVKKKNTLYYTGIGRGSMPKLLLQASVLGTPDSTHARTSVNAFNDVYAWLQTLEAPAYPETIDRALAEAGRPLFEDNCAGCHGTYGATDADDTYPNKVIHLDVVKTDRLYSDYIQQSGIVDWYNSSWYATSYPKSAFVPNTGYVAPPLDGVWATAPYLHNGSVPTLYHLLNSGTRPERWTRTGDSKNYDWKNVGWAYDPAPKRGKWTFDTTLPGYGKEGHHFADDLTDPDRYALIEYLKTL